jgi:membrane-associated phospholipid phosphatase
MIGRPAARGIAMLLAANASFGSAPVQAQPAATPRPLSENFSPLEVGFAAVAAAGGIFLVAAGPVVFPTPAPSMGPAAPGSLDARISAHFYRPGEGRFLARVPDLFGGFVFPLLPPLAYAIPGYSPGNTSHRLMTYIEAMGWTYLLTGVIKYAVGRPRPYTEGAANHPELRRHAGEDNLSFFSGHASSTFAAGTFLAGDLSRYLRRTTLARAAPATRFLVGSVLPYTVGYGVPALVGLSRIIDQQHWPSDVVLGALVGTLIGHLAWAAHFEDNGEPRRRTAGGRSSSRRAAGWAWRPVPVVRTEPSGARVFQLAFATRL